MYLFNISLFHSLIHFLCWSIHLSEYHVSYTIILIVQLAKLRVLNENSANVAGHKVFSFGLINVLSNQTYYCQTLVGVKDNFDFLHK